MKGIFRTLGVAVVCLACAMAEHANGPLTFEARVKAQEAIERVYYQHRIWPKENPQPKPPFEQMVTRQQIEAKVTDYLKKSSALDKFWQRPITGEQVQAEMDRMAKGTKAPLVLEELFAALGNDRSLITECLARPVLAGRLARRFWEAAPLKPLECNAPVNAVSFSAWWQGIAPSLTAELPVSLPTTLNLAQFRAEATCMDAWDNGILDNVPEPRSGQTAVWTGSEMLIWGGGPTTTNTGGRYNPALDTWQPISTGTNCPSPRQFHTAIWTGSVMVVWGGQATSSFTLNDGGRYDPLTDIWQPVTMTGAPGSRELHTAVWTGQVVVIWGGQYYTPSYQSGFSRDGGRYDPATDTWAVVNLTGAPTARRMHTAVWTGTEMVIWGGQGWVPVPLSTGGRYNLATNSWTDTPTASPCPSARYGHTAVWTGTDMIVWGGTQGSNGLNTGARFNPGSGLWTSMSVTAVPSIRYGHVAAWTGSAMVVWGGKPDPNSSLPRLATGGIYDPGADSWSATETTGAPTGRNSHTAVWTGSEMIVWGGWDTSGNVVNSGGRYNPSTLTWTPVGTLNEPTYRDHFSAVWTGAEMIVWGGIGNRVVGTGARYDPALDVWTPTSTSDAPAARASHTAVWTGSAMIIWGGYDGYSGVMNMGGSYDPVTDAWAPTAQDLNTPSGRDDQTALWTGTEMIIWGGWSGSGWYWNGGRYNPSTDSWSTISATNLPSARGQFSSVWTGSSMVIWGGRDADFNICLNTGGIYYPTTDTWAPTAVTGDTPSGRGGHSAVWTGLEMIVWGGTSQDINGLQIYENTGARYSPDGGTWVPLPTTGAPSGRQFHLAFWTGAQMLVWGGGGENFTNSGGRYSESSDTWVSTSQENAPRGNGPFGGVWTGDRMIVWAGANGGQYFPPRPLISENPLSTAACAGETRTLNVQALGTGLTYRWQKDSNTLSEGGPYTGTATAYLTVSGISPAEAGSYTALVTDAAGCVDSSLPAMFTVDSGQPSSPGDSLRVSPAGEYPVLSWNPCPAAEWYEVLRCLSVSGTCIPQRIATVTDTTYQDWGAVEGSYFYAVSAKNACGETF